jgi:hypothetical protein
MQSQITISVQDPDHAYVLHVVGELLSGGIDLGDDEQQRNARAFLSERLPKMLDLLLGEMEAQTFAVYQPAPNDFWQRHDMWPKVLRRMRFLADSIEHLQRD